MFKMNIVHKLLFCGILVIYRSVGVNALNCIRCFGTKGVTLKPSENMGLTSFAVKELKVTQKDAKDIEVEVPYNSDCVNQTNINAMTCKKRQNKCMYSEYSNSKGDEVIYVRGCIETIFFVAPKILPITSGYLETTSQVCDKDGCNNPNPVCTECFGGQFKDKPIINSGDKITKKVVKAAVLIKGLIYEHRCGATSTFGPIVCPNKDDVCMVAKYTKDDETDDDEDHETAYIRSCAPKKCPAMDKLLPGWKADNKSQCCTEDNCNANDVFMSTADSVKVAWSLMTLAAVVCLSLII